MDTSTKDKMVIYTLQNGFDHQNRAEYILTKMINLTVQMAEIKSYLVIGAVPFKKLRVGMSYFNFF